MRKSYVRYIGTVVMLLLSFSANATLHADFTLDVTSEHCHYKAVSFTNTSTGASSYQWSLGNGTTSVIANPVAYYTTVGTFTVRLIARYGSLSDTAYSTVTVPPGVSIDYTADTLICPWTTDTFFNSSWSTVAGPITYNWLINGVPSTAASPSFTFAAPGYYSIYLTATNSEGCSETSVRTNYIHVRNRRTLNFTANAPYLCRQPEDTTRFNPTVSGTGLFTYLWLFGDGTSDTARRPLHTYVFTGQMTYTDTLIVTDTNSCKDTFRKVNYIHFDTLHVRFAVDSVLCRDAQMTLHNTSMPTRHTSTWDFGDTTLLVSDSATLYKQYIFPGDKLIILTVVDSHCVKADTQIVHVYKPHANFHFSPERPCPINPDHDFSLTWMDSVRFWADTPYVSLLWDFGMGGGLTDALDSPWVTFAPPGIKTVTLAVTDIHGCSDTIQKNDTLYDMSIVIDPVSRSWRSRQGCAKDTVNFYGHVYTQIPYRTDIDGPLPYPDSIVFFSWDFGDTSLHSDTILYHNQLYADTATGTNDSTRRTHVYRFPGTYTVKFIVRMLNGCTDSLEKEIIISKPFVLLPTTYTPDSVCYGSPVFFTPHIDTTTDTSIYSHHVDEYHWSFTDHGIPGFSVGDPGTVSHIYAAPGIYMKDTLWAKHEGCWIRQIIGDTVVVDSPMAQFYYLFNCDTPTKVTFIDISLGADSLVWSFGGGAYAYGLDSVSHVFAGFGSFMVTLTAYNHDHTCSNVASHMVTLPAPFINFTVNDTLSSYCLSDSVICAAPGSISTFYTFLRWSVDGTLVAAHTATNPYAYDFRYLFSTPGYHTIMLSGDNYRGCADSFSRIVYVGNPVDSFTISPLVDCSPDTVYFTDQSTAGPGRTVVTYHWQFTPVDSLTGGSTASHLYSVTAPSKFGVTETITDDRGCVGRFTDTVTVIKDSAQFTQTPNDLFPCPGENITFNNTSLGTRLKYLWTFGDGDSSTVKNPGHVYTSSTDTVTVWLTVTDSVYGCTSKTKKTMVITKPDVTMNMSDSVAVCPPLAVTFSATNTEVGYPLTYSWNVFPGIPAYTSSTVNFTYYTPGLYTVTLIATNNRGCKDTAVGHAKVFGYAGDFTATIDSGCMPLPVTFTTVGASGASIVWDFGDGTSTTDSATATHLYNTPGTYVATLLLIQDSCVSTSHDTIIVFPLPVVDTIIGVTSMCMGGVSLLVDATSGGIWSSSDSTIVSLTAGGDITAVSVGTAIISYTVINSHGCISIATHTVVVHPVPVIPPITGLPKECVAGTTTLYNDTLGGVWSSSDDAIAVVDASTGVVTGVGVGTCTITYYYANEFGCSTFVTITDTVITIPSALPVSGTDSICVGDTAMLTNPAGGGYWVSNTTDIATVDSFSGIVTGVSAGVADISYILPTVCGDVFSPYMVTVIDAHTAISGHNAVCSGSTLLLTEVTAGTWTSGNTGVAIVDPITGVVTGVSYGTAIITCTGTYVCGSFTDTFRVLVDPSPIITTNFIVACQTLGPTGGSSSRAATAGMPTLSDDPVIITDADGCLLVCENTIVRYYGNGVDSGHFTWTCTGGTILAMYGDNNDSIDVQWPTPGVTGTISMTDTFSHCTGSASLCIKVVARPIAIASASSGAVCLGNQIAFFDHSTADTSSPIISWFWDFGDGTGSPLQNPLHTYGVSNVYFVTLIVHNGCGCADTFHLKVYVEDNEGPEIHCPSIVCEGEHATYSIADSTACGPVWTVTGGTVISGAGTSSIDVEWDTPPANGLGYVSVIDTCGNCSSPSIVQVPIILKTADITGPSNVCVNQQYAYTLPLWAATDYQWGVLGSPGIILGPSNDREMVVQFPAPGYYTIHGWYNNRIKLCGGDVTKVIYVRDAVYIAGTTSACFDAAASYTYTLSGGYSGTWTVTDPFGSTSTSGPSTNVTITTPVPGVYTINASGDFCVNPVTMTSIALPPAIDSVTGPDTICLNRVYTYNAYNDVPGTVYSWEAVGGHVIPASGSSIVDVIWTSSGTKQLKVRHDPDSDPHCIAPVTVIDIVQEDINPVIAGDDLPCANARRQYSSGYYRADNYEWKIFPDSVGSVVTGNHSADVTALWNNVIVPTNAMLIVKVQKCDTSISDTFHVVVQPSPIVYITTSDTAVCAGVGITFTPHNGTGSYQWDFGDGVTVTSSVPVYHLFPMNNSAGNIVYNVRLTSLLDTASYCPSTGVGFAAVAIKPSPVAFASTGDDLRWCNHDTVSIVGTVTDNVGTSLSFQWYLGSTAISGAVSPDYSPIGAGVTSTFSFVVIASNGCSDTSNGIRFIDVCSGTSDTSGLPPYYPPGPPCCGGPAASFCGGITIDAITTCNVVNLTSTGVVVLPHWHAFKQPSAGAWDPAGDFYGTSASAIYDTPGIYRFAYVFSTAIGCRDTLIILDTVGIVPDFQYFLRCAPGNDDSVFFVDHSVRLSWFAPTGHTWSPLSVTGTGGNAVGVFGAGSTPTVTETVSGTPGAFSCAVTKTLTIPARHPHFGFTFTPNNVCEGIPISFTPGSTAGIVSYLWDFGNGGTNIRQNPDCTYAVTSGAFQFFSSHLIVTDTLGCAFDTGFTVTIYRNSLAGQMDIDTVICPSMIPYTIAYLDGPFSSSSSYKWSIPDSTVIPYDDVYTSGAYSVKVYDIHGCQFMPVHSENVRVLKTPRIQIRGRLNYCGNENISLNGYAGHGVSYTWYINDGVYATTPGINLMLDTGTYIFKLKLTMLDTLSGVYCDDIDSVIVHVLPVPDVPVITGPFEVNCDLYHLQLVATATEPGTFNWSNGPSGSVDDIYDGGPFRVWFTNSAGCKSSADTYVPVNPSWYFQYLPTGCYDFCKARIPLTLYGPPNVLFNSWDWVHVDVSDTSGSGVMPPYDIMQSGSYQWILQTGDLCPQKSGLFNVDILACDKCDKTFMDIKAECSANPACFKLNINIADGAGGTFTIGTNNGPLDVSSGTLLSGIPLAMTFVFTAIDTDATNVIVYLEVTHPDGTKCMIALNVSLPDCSWIAEKHAGDTTTRLANIGTAMLVYPNPATQLVHISYKFGDGTFAEKSLTVFDQLGRKLAETHVTENNGNWDVNTADFVPGIYIIRMEGDGKTLQTQRLIVNN